MSSQDILFHVPSVIDEHAPLPRYQGFHRQKFVLDLRDLKLMNSLGIRAWVHWIRSFQAQNEIWLVNCPVIFLNIAAIVSEVVPQGVRIDSLILRYVHEESGAALRGLLQRPATGAWRVPESLESGGLIYEFDGILSKSLGRLKTEAEFIDAADESRFTELGLRILTQE